MFTIQMPNAFDSMFNKSWISPQFQMFMSEWNPWGDAEIARIQLMRYNLARSCAIYDSDMQRLYWNQLSFDDRLYAEAQYDYYKSMHDIWAVKELDVIRERYMEKDLEILDENWQPFGKKIKTYRDSYPPNIPYEDWMRGMIAFDAPHALMPPSGPWTYRFQQALLEPGKWEPHPLQGGNPAFYSSWRNHQAYNQLNLNISANLWAYDLNSARPLNELKGVSALTHSLLVNSSIPLPNQATFLAWFTICGLGAELLTREDASGLTRMCGFTPRMLLTYILPMMPRTKEHGLKSVVGSDDSHADHSLPARSSGHDRDSFGRIKYGIWSVRSVLLGNDDGKIRMHDVMQDNLEDSTQAANGFHYRAKNMTTIYGADRVAQPFNAIWDSMMLNRVTSFLMDPYQANRDPMSLPIHGARNADIGMRAVSKQLGLHFRFDESEEGIEASLNWCAAFELCAYHHMMANQDAINKSFFEAILGLTVIPSGIKEKRKFNLDSLDGAV